jgi:hypothetical protein
VLTISEAHTSTQRIRQVERTTDVLEDMTYLFHGDNVQQGMGSKRYNV